MSDKFNSFEELQCRLIRHLSRRIENGEFTERGLARILGISQPQMHHVRKGVRRLSVALADRILVKLGISVLDLLGADEVLAFLDLATPDWREKAARKPVQREDGRPRARTNTAG